MQIFKIEPDQHQTTHTMHLLTNKQTNKQTNELRIHPFIHSLSHLKHRAAVAAGDSTGSIQEGYSR